MGFFQQLADKYDYREICNFKYDIAIVCPAIYPQKWLSLHSNLSTNKLNFILIFIGHIRPNFPLPDNVVYIYSQMNVCQCSDIGHHYAFRENLAPYITFIADDQKFDNSFLDNLVKSYQDAKIQYPNRPLWVGPQSEQKGGTPDIMGWPAPNICWIALVQSACIAIEDARNLGFSDKSYRGFGAYLDKQLRFYSELNGMIVIDTRVPYTKETSGTSNMTKNTERHDRPLLKSLYSFSETSDEQHEVYLTDYKKSRNHFYKKRIIVKRTKPVTQLPESALIFEEPNIEHLAIKF